MYISLNYPQVEEDNFYFEDYTSLNTQRHQGSPTPISYLEGKREAGAPDIVEGSREQIKITNLAVRTLIRPEASPGSEAFSFTNHVKCLESIEGMDGSTYIKAVKLFKDVEQREMFMAMSTQRRLVWLASLE